MDSCHLFNFLFGTKRATSEFSRCFKTSFNESSKSDEASKRDGQPTTDHNNLESAQGSSQSQPLSPLKQLKLRINRLAGRPNVSNATTGKTNIEDNGYSNIDPLNETFIEQQDICKTYTANLVRVIDDRLNDQLEPNQYDDTEKPFIVSKSPVQGSNDKTGPDVQSIDSHEGSSIQPDEGSVIIGPTNDKLQANNNIRRLILYDSCDQDGQDKEVCSSFDVLSSVEAGATSPISAHSDESTLCANLSNYSTAKFSFKRNDKTNRSLVRNLVMSFESNGQSFDQASNQIVEQRRYSADNCFQLERDNQQTKPCSYVKPLPPKTLPKSKRAKFLNMQLSLNRPLGIQQLFQNPEFLRIFFDKLDPLDRCSAAQVCRLWRDILYSDPTYWKGKSTISFEIMHNLVCNVYSIFKYTVH